MDRRSWPSPLSSSLIRRTPNKQRRPATALINPIVSLFLVPYLVIPSLCLVWVSRPVLSVCGVCVRVLKLWDFELVAEFEAWHVGVRFVSLSFERLWMCMPFRTWFLSLRDCAKVKARNEIRGNFEAKELPWLHGYLWLGFCPQQNTAGLPRLWGRNKGRNPCPCSSPCPSLGRKVIFQNNTLSVLHEDWGYWYPSISVCA